MAIMTGNIRTLGWPLGLDADDVLVRARGDYASAAESDVRDGTTYGGGGTEFEGALDVVDTVDPLPCISSAAIGYTNDSPIACVITFSESVTGFVLTDIVVTNGTAGNFAGSGADYTFDITPTVNGEVTADIAAAVCVDGAGNDNVAAAQFTRTYSAATVASSDGTAYRRDSIVWIQAAALDELGEPGTTTETTISARVEWGERRVVDQSGTERLAAATVDMASKPTPGEDKFRIDGVEHAILSYREIKVFSRILGYKVAIA